MKHLVISWCILAPVLFLWTSTFEEGIIFRCHLTSLCEDKTTLWPQPVLSRNVLLNLIKFGSKMNHLLKKLCHVFFGNQKHIFMSNQIDQDGEVSNLFIVLDLPIQDLKDLFWTKLLFWIAFSWNLTLPYKRRRNVFGMIPEEVFCQNGWCQLKLCFPLVLVPPAVFDSCWIHVFFIECS